MEVIKVSTKKINSKQKKAAEILVGNSFDGDLETVCQKAGISTNLFYQWLENEEFRRYIEALTGKAAAGKIPEVWKSLLEQCVKGNVQAIKLYFDLKEKYGDDTKAEAEELIRILDDIPKEKKNGTAK